MVSCGFEAQILSASDVVAPASRSSASIRTLASQSPALSTSPSATITNWDVSCFTGTRDPSYPGPFDASLKPRGACASMLRIAVWKVCDECACSRSVLANLLNSA